MESKILKNAIRCKLCGDVIESRNRYDYVECSCGECVVGGGTMCLKRMDLKRTCDPENWEELSEISFPETYPKNF